MSRTDKWDLRFLELAKHIGSWSRDPSTKVGAVITDSQKRIVSVGFNGFPQPMPDVASFYEDREEKLSRVVHAEINALIFANGIPAGATLYTYPLMPCERCVVQLLQAGIRRFVAPIAGEIHAQRWGKSFMKTRQYVRECGAVLLELPVAV
jgi:dCMP deaminase